jgi:hypothetical protein
MSVQTTFFGVTKLTGKDAKKFRRQVTYGRPSKAAATSLASGSAILKELHAKGAVVAKVKAK